MLSRFHHVLIPLDFSEKNEPALQVTLELARSNTARVTLLHVIERIEADAEDLEAAAFYETLQRRADAELDQRSKPFADAGLSVECRVRFGKRAPEIVNFAEENNVNLIVLSSHRLNPGEPIKGLATVSYQVGLFAACPVLLVK